MLDEEEERQLNDSYTALRGMLSSTNVIEKRDIAFQSQMLKAKFRMRQKQERLMQRMQKL